MKNANPRGLHDLNNRDAELTLVERIAYFFVALLAFIAIIASNACSPVKGKHLHSTYFDGVKHSVYETDTALIFTQSGKVYQVVKKE